MKKIAFYAAGFSLAVMATSNIAVQAQEPEAAAAVAAPAIPVEIGAPVFDIEGAPIGNIVSNDGTNVVVSLGEKQVALPANSFGKNEKGLVLGLTVAQLTASLAQQDAAAAAALTAALQPEAEVRSVNGSAVIGKIKSVTGDVVVLSAAQGNVGLPVSAFFMAPHGLSTSFTAEQFTKAVADAAAAAQVANPAPAAATAPPAE